MAAVAMAVSGGSVIPERFRRRTPVPSAKTSASVEAKVSISNGDALALARNGCALCHGLGRRVVLRSWVYCPCVLRAVAGYVANECRKIQYEQVRCLTSSIYWERIGNTGGIYGRKREEFLADAESAAKRALSEKQLTAWRVAVVGDGTWKDVAAALKVSKGDAFHLIYTARERWGRECIRAERKGAAIYPTGLYFANEA